MCLVTQTLNGLKHWHHDDSMSLIYKLMAYDTLQIRYMSQVQSNQRFST
jgi:hypothetical protein